MTRTSRGRPILALSVLGSTSLVDPLWAVSQHVRLFCDKFNLSTGARRNWLKFQWDEMFWWVVRQQVPVCPWISSRAPAHEPPAGPQPKPPHGPSTSHCTAPAQAPARPQPLDTQQGPSPWTHSRAPAPGPTAGPQPLDSQQGPSPWTQQGPSSWTQHGPSPWTHSRAPAPGPTAWPQPLDPQLVPAPGPTAWPQPLDPQQSPSPWTQHSPSPWTHNLAPAPGPTAGPSPWICPWRLLCGEEIAIFDPFPRAENPI